MPTRSMPAGDRPGALLHVLVSVFCQAVAGFFVIVGALNVSGYLVGCAAPSSPEDLREEVHLLRLDIEVLGDELVATRPELAPTWAAAKAAADVAAAAWDGHLTGDVDRAALEAALADAILAGDALAAELAGDGSDTAALIRAALRVIARRALLALEAPGPPYPDAQGATEEPSQGVGEPSENVQGDLYRGLDDG